MPKLARSRLCLLPALGALLTLLASPSQAAMQSLNDQALGEISGRDGVTLNLDLKANIGKISWQDDGGSLQVRNLTIDNGCNVPGLCPSVVAYGAAKLYFQSSLVIAPTLKVDVIDHGGVQKLQLTLPDLKTTSDQLIADGLITEPLTIRMRIAGELGLGNAGSPGASSLGSFEIVNLSNIQGQFRVWGQ